MIEGGGGGGARTPPRDSGSERGEYMYIPVYNYLEIVIRKLERVKCKST